MASGGPGLELSTRHACWPFSSLFGLWRSLTLDTGQDSHVPLCACCANTCKHTNMQRYMKSGQLGRDVPPHDLKY